MPCCGRADNRANKGEAAYYARYAYLSKEQKARQLALIGSRCDKCDAITSSDSENKCTVCGDSKTPKSGD